MHLDKEGCVSIIKKEASSFRSRGAAKLGVLYELQEGGLTTSPSPSSATDVNIGSVLDRSEKFPRNKAEKKPPPPVLVLEEKTEVPGAELRQKK